MTGLYFFDRGVVAEARKLVPSQRGELEIVDVINAYRQRDALHVEILGRGMAWLDTGTPESLQEASSYVEAVEKRQGLKVACPEEVAHIMGYIDDAQIMKIANEMKGSAYGDYLRSLVER